MKTERIKRMVMEFIVYTAVVLTTAHVLGDIKPSYQPTRTTIQGAADVVYVQVPVPLEVGMEGKQFTFNVNCSMKNNAVRCGL